MEEKTTNYLAQIGYLYHYPQLDHPSDKFRMDIYISEAPQDQFFGIKHANFSIKKGQGIVDLLTVTHPWNFEKQAQVCAGPVILEDQKNNREEAFTFGGNLKIDDQETHTICMLVSNAPILEITLADPRRKLLVDELEILFAERSAAHTDRTEYEVQLCKADPLALYFACLQAMIQKFEQFPHKDDLRIQFLAYLHAQQHRLEAAGLSRYSTPGLEELL